MKKVDFLFEIGTEELPDKTLLKLAESLTESLKTYIEEAKLTFTRVETFATPRRLATLFHGLSTKQPDTSVKRTGPKLSLAKDKQGNFTPAALGFAKSCQVNVEALTVEDDRLTCVVDNKGSDAALLLPPLIEKSLKQLPVAKWMRWSDKNIAFVRPIHWMVALLGKKTLAQPILGITPGKTTRGHRFHAPRKISLTSPKAYGATLKKAKVIAEFATRRNLIKEAINKEGDKLKGQAIIDEALLDDVTSIVEWPCVLSASFSSEFLTVPKEALISSMQTHQRCFPVTDGAGKLLPYFIVVANIKSTNKKSVIHGNEWVMRARLSDAKFFYEQDLKTPLSCSIEPLKRVTFQARLGTLWDKATRTKTLMKSIVGDDEQGSQAAELAKCDLVSQMVGEFPELQGIMGEYYALHEGVSEQVACALREQYMPRGKSDDTPSSTLGSALAIADRLDTLVGIFGIGQIPTGEKDPFGLRRAAISIARIILSRNLSVDLKFLIETAVLQYPAGTLSDATSAKVLDFILERFKVLLTTEHQLKQEIVASVLCKPLSDLLDIYKRIQAVNDFSQHSACPVLASANKRVRNILKQQKERLDYEPPNQALMTEPVEIALAQSLFEKEKATHPMFERGEYQAILATLAELRAPVDGFFEHVMVMVEDEKVRDNRIKLLIQLQSLFMQVADLSYLQSIKQ